ncbi:tetratricopeptide repeat protein [Virgisporangium aurantiacum]|uniref:Tetratricopeptide repeat-containing protein n=1 Tax=Virgisporangium aurantiacum TaxID=175570 RepID=A0A8J4E6M1_9ACTN|nr:tetratricopeptide repeat protein [Virgisporangium aurantiacum]GIJ63369.1 hypothetical protein Vau01_108850 [Virgisporangium aurantiacum]
MEPTKTDAFTALPDPARSACLDDLVERLRRLKRWAGDPSYETIKDRVNTDWTAAGRPASELTRRSTLANCFRPGRRRMNTDLVLAVVTALHPDPEYVSRWREALRAVTGEMDAVAQVRVYDSLPPDISGFTGRTAELDRLRLAADQGDAVVISAIEGMAGVGKTQLAVHAGHRLHREKPFEQVLFVNLRGFHPDPAQPPADPAAVLDGFLRLLGVSSHRIPAGLAARTAAYRDRLAGVRALVVLDNAVDANQVRPLLPATPGCLTLVTSRHSLSDLNAVTRLAVDVFTPDEAVRFLAESLPDMPGGSDPRARERIARRSGYLPLALSLIIGRIRGTSGWTLTDHADRLDHRHQERRLDSGLELALDVSYRHLPAGPQRLLRLAALHPGQDVDAYAAAALADTDLAVAKQWLNLLRADHLLQPAAPGRYTFHDLVRAYATTRAYDEERRSERHAALTRLFDHYLSAAAAAMNALFPAEVNHRPQVAPATTPAPDLTDPDTALAWLDTEQPTLVNVAAHTATHGWYDHTTRLAHTLSRHLASVSHTDAVAVHDHALHAARSGNDLAGQARALISIGSCELRLGRPGPAEERCQEGLRLHREIGDEAGQAHALVTLSSIARWTSRSESAVDHLLEALRLYRQADDRIGEGNTLSALGIALEEAGRPSEGIDYTRQALTLSRQTGNRSGEAMALHVLGDAEVRVGGRYGKAGDLLRAALTLYQQLGNRRCEAGVLESLGRLHIALGLPDEATSRFRQALILFRELGNRSGETEVLIGLGEAAEAAERTASAVDLYAAAHSIAADIGEHHFRARADAGLGRAHHALGDLTMARAHYERAVALYAELDRPEAGELRKRLQELAP